MALFPRLADCSHFHYENVSVHPFSVKLKDVEAGGILLLTVDAAEGGWHVRRTWSQLVSMDKRFHDCIISRATTGLYTLGDLFGDRRSVCSVSSVFDDDDEGPSAARYPQSRIMDDDLRIVDEHSSELKNCVREYFSTFSTYTSTNINCAPILNFFEMDNHGYRLTVPDEDIVNKPAVAAAQVVRRHVAQDSDEISLEVGDFVSIVDMRGDAPWWRAKRGTRVGFFPADCVSVIGRDSPGVPVATAGAGDSITDPSGYKQVALTRGKTISRLILALFGKSRPTPLQLRRKGILRDRVFGCDLGVYLSASRREVPLPLMMCAQIIEDSGITDGIYRRPGAQTHVQRLRLVFDEDRRPEIERDLVSSDIHCFSSLLKTYFGELPTPLFSHTIYQLLRETLTIRNEEDRLNATFRILSRLPPPYFRTARYLFVHLNKMAAQHVKTLMNAKNLAICWAPNLMKPSGELDYFRPDPSIMAEVRDNPHLVEYIITYAPQLFADRPPNWSVVMRAKLLSQSNVRAASANVNGVDSVYPDLISLAEARRRFGHRKVANVATKDARDLVTRQRAHSELIGPSRRDGRDGDDAFRTDEPGEEEKTSGGVEAVDPRTSLISGQRVAPSSPILCEMPPCAPSSPTTASRSRINLLLPALQQKQQLIQRQHLQRLEGQRQSDLLSGRSSSPSGSPAIRPRSHSLVEATARGPEASASADLMSEMRQEQMKRRKRLKNFFSPARRQPSRTRSDAGGLASALPEPADAPSARRVGASVFYVRANSVPAPPPPAAAPASQPTPRRRLLVGPGVRVRAGSRHSTASSRSSSSICSAGASPPAKPPRPPPPASPTSDCSFEKENVRTNFQRLQHSWQRRSARATPSPVLPQCPIATLSPTSSSSSSSSSSTASLHSSNGSLTPPAVDADADGDVTPKGNRSPVMVTARATPAVAPPPIIPRNRSARASNSHVAEYENLEHYRRLSGIKCDTTGSPSVDSSVELRAKPVLADNENKSDRPPVPSLRSSSSILRPSPSPRRFRHSNIESSGGDSFHEDAQLSSSPTFQRNAPVRQSLPTRMDRLLTNFPKDIRCYLPETNV